jgi:putative aldouronate transport system substrate-binding protein
MSRAEKFFLIAVVVLVVGGMLLTPTVPRGQVQVAKQVDWSRVHDDPTQKLTISWMGTVGTPTAHKGSWVEHFLEQRFNVEFMPRFIDWPAYAQQRPLVMASGDIPDVNWDPDATVLRRNIENGFVMELPYDVILKYAPTYIKQVNHNGNGYGATSWINCSYNGKNYGFPTYAAEDIFPNIALWRMDWLRKVGINKVPETLDEMHEALRRFRNDDPDGDGIKDTYGYFPCTTRGDMYFNDVFCANNILPQDFALRDGQLIWGGITPEAKKSLAILHQWYTEDLIDPDFATQTAGSDPWTKFTNGKIGYMISLGEDTWRSLDLTNPNSAYSKMRAINPKVELVPAKPLIAVDGKRWMHCWGGGGHTVWFGKQVAKHPEIAIRVLKMFEAYATDRDLYVTSRIGKRGVHWQYSPQRGVYPLPPYDQNGADLRNLLLFDLFENCYGFYSMSSVPLDFTRDLLPKGKDAFRMTYSNPAWGMKSAFSAGCAPSASAYLQDLMTYQTITYLEMIRGDKPMSYFATFVENWKQRGGAVITSEVNDKMAELHTIWPKVGYQPPQ